MNDGKNDLLGEKNNIYLLMIVGFVAAMLISTAVHAGEEKFKVTSMKKSAGASELYIQSKNDQQITILDLILNDGKCAYDPYVSINGALPVPMIYTNGQKRQIKLNFGQAISMRYGACNLMEVKIKTLKGVITYELN